jgi:glycosyltransferase involved in cell wall biosynthesis
VEKMRIAMIGSRGMPANYGGVERAVEEISSRLASNGHRIVVYCRFSNKKQEKRYNQNIELLTLPTIETKHLGTLIHVFLATLNVLSKKVDIVHYHSLGPSIFSFLPRLCGKKCIVTIHALDWRRKKWGVIARSSLKLCEYSAIFFPNETIVVSKRLKRYFEKKFRKQIYYIPNGVEGLQRIISKSEKLHEYDLESNRYILAVGRLVPEKGFHYLIDAFDELESDMKLVIVGAHSFTERYYEFLKAVSKSKKSESKIKFLGFVQREALKELYLNAYLFVLPSELEGSSISLLEAMSYEKCVLTSDIPECVEIVENHGFFFKSEDYKDLKTQLQMLIDNPKLVVETGIEAKRYIIQKYNWDEITKNIERLYHSLIKSD